MAGLSADRKEWDWFFFCQLANGKERMWCELGLGKWKRSKWSMKKVRCHAGNKVNTRNTNDQWRQFNKIWDRMINWILCGEKSTWLHLNSPSWLGFWNIYCSFGFDIFSPFTQRCQGRLDFMKGDGIDERILKDTKKKRQLQCLLLQTVSVISLLSAFLIQSDWGENEERLWL